MPQTAYRSCEAKSTPDPVHHGLSDLRLRLKHYDHGSSFCSSSSILCFGLYHGCDITAPSPSQSTSPFPPPSSPAKSAASSPCPSPCPSPPSPQPSLSASSPPSTSPVAPPPRHRGIQDAAHRRSFAVCHLHWRGGGADSAAEGAWCRCGYRGSSSGESRCGCGRRRRL